MQDLNNKVTGGTLTAAEWNEVPSEIQNVIENLGITLSGADLNQLGKGIAGYVANGTFYTDSGAADAYVLTTIGLKQSLTAYTDGATFEFIADNANTGASTVNVATLGVKNIKLADGTDPAAGDIDGRTVLKFDSANDRCELVRTRLNIVTFTSSGTYNPPAGVKALDFTVIGAGGGGGGVDGQGAGTTASSVAGAAGGTSLLTTNNIESSYTITIGAKGTGGAAGNNPGTGGGNTTVVSVVQNIAGNGGAPGSGLLGSSASTGANRALGGSATGGDTVIAGQNSSGVRVVTGDPAGFSLAGASFLGGGGCLTVSTATAGTNAIVAGSGGGAAMAAVSSSNFAGGDGADGLVLIKEYF